jgi:methyl-accepting chemotaxis protein
MANGNRRRKLLVDSSQRQLLGVYFVHFMILLVVFFAALLFIFNQQVIRSELTVDQKQEFASLMMSFAHRVWPAMWVLFLIMVVHAMYVSHKIAGPLYRIRNVLTLVASGNLTTRARIRRGDYLTLDAETVNDMVDELDKRIGRMHGEWNTAAEAMAALDRSIEEGSVEEAKERYNELSMQLDRWKDALDEFEFTRAKPAARKSKSTANTTTSTKEAKPVA